MFTVWSYCVYLALSIGMTVWVGSVLERNGRAFLREAFLGNEELATSVNRLLVVGFYLVNIGFVLMALKYGDKPANLEGSFEFVSTKVGVALLFLGCAHFFNLGILSGMRKSAIRAAEVEARRARFEGTHESFPTTKLSPSHS